MRRILGNPHLLSVAAQGVTALLGFGSFLILVRALEPSEFGIWALYLAAATVFDMARSGFVHSGLVRYASGSTAEAQREFVGSGLVLTSLATSALALPLLIASLSLQSVAGDWMLFLTWWPALGFASLPAQFAGWVQQSRSRFDRVLVIRAVVNGTFLALVAFAFMTDALTVRAAIVLQVVAALSGSAAAWLAGWFRFGDARFATRASAATLSRFGLFSTGTLIGANALKSSDTFLLGALLGPVSVGLYSAAQRAVEALEIPLRGLSASLYPELSRTSQPEAIQRFGRILARAIALATMGLVPFAIALYAGADLVIQLIAGDEYAGSAVALRMFAIAILFLPADRFTGLALDSLGRPGLNTAKVLTMVAVNVVGDIVAIVAFGSIEAVAAVTCVMMATGAVLGIVLVLRELGRVTGTPRLPVLDLRSTWRLALRRA